MDVKLEPARPDDPEVRKLYGAFIREADGPLGIDLEAEIAAGPPADLTPPNGLLLIARVGGEPAGLGGVRHLDTDVAEVKSMYVTPVHRGKGLARQLLAELEDVARRHGCEATRLDTSDYLTEAIGLYRAAGYLQIPDYNRNPKASLWFERLLHEEPVRIVPYDPRWPQLAERERAALEEAIGEWAVGGIHHVGSTAVPGLDAKPIIDILVGVEDLETSRACFEPLAQLGYMYAPYRSEEMHWFCKPHPSRRTHHLHLVPAGSRRFADELAFRDRLRAHPEIAREYASLKHDLAARFRDDREAYTDAKADFIRKVLNPAGE
ncbi:MAG: bifunctional GNAT family N-acetyltransferase/GrpB family protein [Solirubrobacterales bacterium]